MKVLIAFATAVVPQVCWAVPIADPCPIPGLPCTSLPTQIEASIAEPALLAFSSFLFMMFVYYGVRLLLTTGDDNAQTEVRYAFQYAIFGIIIVSGVYIFRASLVDNPSIVDTGAIGHGIINVVKDVIVGLMYIALVVTIAFQGVRLIISEDENQASIARKRFVEGLIGAAVIAIVDELIESLMTTSGGSSILAEEIAGIARFLATLFGFLAVIAIIVGGILLVFSVQDTLKEKGKKTILAAIVSIIVVLLAYGLVTLLIT